MGKATQYHGDNKLSYSLKVSTHSSISVSAQSNREVMFITTPALEQAAPAASDVPAPLPLPLGDSTTPTAADVQQPLKQQPPRRSEWRALLLWLLGRLGAVLYILVRVPLMLFCRTTLCSPPFRRRHNTSSCTGHGWLQSSQVRRVLACVCVSL
jgi:hypothetical protein